MFICKLIQFDINFYEDVLHTKHKYRVDQMYGAPLPFWPSLSNHEEA